MSRIGKKPIVIEQGIEVTFEGSVLRVTGSKGALSVRIPVGVGIEKKEQILSITVEKKSMANLHGLVRTEVANAMTGVSKGWQKTLELVGVGYRAEVQSGVLVLNLGFSHPVKITAPEKITFTVNENKIIIAGPDKQAVGEIAARIRKVKPPEPYKGKGIRYLDEKIRKKLGKAAKAVGGAPGGK